MRANPFPRRPDLSRQQAVAQRSEPDTLLCGQYVISKGKEAESARKEGKYDLAREAALNAFRFYESIMGEEAGAATPDAYTYANLIKALGEGQCLEELKNVYDIALRQGKTDAAVHNSVIIAVTKPETRQSFLQAGFAYENAVALKQTNVVTHSCMISAAHKSGNLELAWSVYQRAIQLSDIDGVPQVDLVLHKIMMEVLATREFKDKSILLNNQVVDVRHMMLPQVFQNLINAGGLANGKVRFSMRSALAMMTPAWQPYHRLFYCQLEQATINFNQNQSLAVAPPPQQSVGVTHQLPFLNPPTYHLPPGSMIIVPGQPPYITSQHLPVIMLPGSNAVPPQQPSVHVGGTLRLFPQSAPPRIPDDQPLTVRVGKRSGV